MNTHSRNLKSIAPSPRAVTDADSQIGAKLRLYRAIAKMSQGELGAALGVTFQQVQKYERGTNRIAATRLQQIAHILGRQVTEFLPSLDEATGLPLVDETLPHSVLAFIESPDGPAFAIALARIPAPSRRQILNVARSVGDALAEGAA